MGRTLHNLVPRREPVGDVHRKYALNLAVAELGKIDGAPELVLRDGGERPGGVEVHGMAIENRLGDA